MDEGMVKCGLEAAAARLPFLPIRAGLGPDVPAFWEGRAQDRAILYPTPMGARKRSSMPALRLDAAFVHLDRADCHGNAAYTGVDPYMDAIYLAAADRRYLETDELVSTPGTGRLGERERLIINRMDVDRVVHTPNGAHFTFSGSYGRDEAFQRFYVESAGDEQTWTAFQDALPTTSTRRPPGQKSPSGALRGGKQVSTTTDITRAEYCVTACADYFTGAGEIMALAGMAPVPLLGARLARALTAEADLLITDGECLILADTRRSGRWARRRAGCRSRRSRRRRVGPSPRRDGRQPGRPIR